jgi:tetratricopeptide (TPR) repeat protein
MARSPGAVALAAGLLTIAATTPLAPPIADAAPSAAIAEDRAQLVRGLEAQYQSTIIHERRLADDRETRLIADYEIRLKAARTRADQGVAGARAELEACRGQYAALVGAVAERDAASHAELAAYHAEVQAMAATATPERTQALQRFADGDRVGAWPVLEALRLAEDRAIESAANARRAVRWRGDAALRLVMRDHGEATTADALRLYDEAARLDPSDFWTQIWRTRLSQEAGDLEGAQAAADAAARAAPDARLRAVALSEHGAIAAARGDHQGALDDAQAVLVIYRRYLASEAMPPPEISRGLVVVLRQVGRQQAALGQLEPAAASLEEAVRSARQSHAAEPADARMALDLTAALQSQGDIHRARGDLTAAKACFDEAIAIERRLLAADPASLRLKFDIAVFLDEIGALQALAGDEPGAVASGREALGLLRAIVAADPGSVVYRRGLANMLGKSAQRAIAGGDKTAAEAALTEGVALLRPLAQAGSADARQDLAALLGQLGGLAMARGDLTLALAHLREASAIIDALLAQGAATLDVQRSRWGVLAQIGDVQLTQGDTAGAAASYRQAFVGLRDLMQANPSSGQLQLDVGLAMVKLAALPGATVKWALVVQYFEHLQSQGLLPPAGTPILDDARRRAAAEEHPA